MDREIYLGAGCFWCVEAVFQRLHGVKTVVSGYMGGHIKNPAYREVCMGTTGHGEVIKVVYDEAIITLTDLLKVFWTTHDPTTLNRQGADKGTQYRSAIFFTNVDQQDEAIDTKNHYASSIWDDPIVTEITEAEQFYVAEDYHQDFYTQNESQPYCSIVIPPKLAKLEKHFTHLLKS